MTSCYGSFDLFVLFISLICFRRSPQVHAHTAGRFCESRRRCGVCGVSWRRRLHQLRRGKGVAAHCLAASLIRYRFVLRCKRDSVAVGGRKERATCTLLREPLLRDVAGYGLHDPYDVTYGFHVSRISFVAMRCFFLPSRLRPLTPHRWCLLLTGVTAQAKRSAPAMATWTTRRGCSRSASSP